MDNKIVEVLSTTIENLCKMDITDIRRSIETAVNVFGFKPAPYIDAIKDSEYGIQNCIILAICCTENEAVEQTWIDGRNEISNKYLRQIYNTTEFKAYANEQLAKLKDNELKWFRQLAGEIGTSLHRTNLQTFTELIFYILGTETTPALESSVKNILGDDKEFYRMPMI